MITIIHGDDTVTSRNLFFELRKKSPEGVLVDGEKISVTDLMQIFEGSGLFAEEKVVFIENLLTKRKGQKEFDALLHIIKEKTLEHEIIFWENKELDKRVLLLFPHAVVKTCKIPQTLFLFLDSLRPGNSKQLLQQYQKVQQTTDSEMIFFMMIRQIRILLALHDASSEPIDEIKRLQPWQVNKFQKQAKLFTKEQLIAIHHRLFEIDYQQKTGDLPYPLTTAIDMLLLEL